MTASASPSSGKVQFRIDRIEKGQVHGIRLSDQRPITVHLRNFKYRVRGLRRIEPEAAA